jgi:HK97 family phage portal protein
LGFFQRLKSAFNQKNDAHALKMIVERGNGFYSWNGKVYESDIIRSCIRPKYKAVGKLVATHVRNSADGLKINPEPYMRFLLEEPNPYMTGQMLQEKLSIQLALNNNAFALIVRDDFGYPTGIYPIPTVMAEAVYADNGDLNIRFTFRNGKTKTFRYRDIIHLRQDYNENDVFGESPAKSLEPLMDIVTTTDQGIVNAIKNSNIIRWIMKFTTVQRPEDVKRSAKEFADNYLSIEDGSSPVATADAKYDLQQVKPDSYVPHASQMDRTITRLYNFFNTNEKIIQSKYNEDEWNAYYESEIEPLAVQMAGEFTRKLFSRKERGFGNKIIFESSSLQYAAMSTKLNLMQMVDRGAMTPNEWRHVMNMGPIEGGDKPIRRLDTAEVNSQPVEGGDDQ